MTAHRAAAFAASLVVVCLMTGCQEPAMTATRTSGQQQDDDTGTVTRVLDGDTVDVTIGGRAERVRLVGVNAPEISHDGDRADCYGEASAAHVRAQLTGHLVTLEHDPSQPPADKYGRRLAYLELEGNDVAAGLIRDGDAVVYTYDRAHPFTRHDTYQRAQNEARAAGRGLWSPTTCAGDFDR